MLSSVKLSPSDNSWVSSFQEESESLSGDKSEDWSSGLDVGARNISNTVTWVNLVTREQANIGFDDHLWMKKSGSEFYEDVMRLTF